MLSWLKKMLQKDAAVTAKTLYAGGVLGGSQPKIVTLPVKSPPQHQTVADKLDWLCHKHKATYDRRRVNDAVVIRLTLDDDTVLSGRGETSLQAVSELYRKLEGK